jgi:DNA-binding MarR family transcriptional regulator
VTAHRDHAARRLAAAGSTFASYLTLGMLAAYGPVIQRRLAAMLGIEAATLTRQLERLERDGLVARVRRTRPRPPPRRRAR